MKTLSVDLGSCLHLVPEDRIAESLRCSRRAIRGLMDVLGVPYLEVGKTRWVNRLSLVLALHAVTRPGQPPFLAPGSESIRKNRTEGAKRRLDMGYFVRNVEMFVQEMAYAMKLFKGKLVSKDLEVLGEAAQRMVQAALQVSGDELVAEFQFLAASEAKGGE